MNHKKILLLLFLSLFIFKEVSSQINAKSYPLKGINEIYVLIEKIHEYAIEIGLTEDRLKTVTELRLRKEGITIKKEIGQNTPYLYVNVNVIGRAFHLSLLLTEWVRLFRNPSIECYARTWEESFTGTHANKSEFIVSSLSILLDEFFNDWYKANPKK